MNIRKIIGAIIGVLAFTALIAGATYAYFTAAVSSNNVVGGTSYKFEVELTVDTIRKASKLIPLSDNLVPTALKKSTPCVDNYNYEVCSLYTIVLRNTGTAENLISNIVTGASTYTTSNLRAALFSYDGTNYTAITDNLILNNTMGTSVNFLTNSSQTIISIPDGTSTASTVTYYLAVWLTETGEDQGADQGKTFTGSINFQSSAGERLTSRF